MFNEPIAISNKEPEKLTKRRLWSFEELKKSSLPSQKEDNWKYTDMKSFSLMPISRKEISSVKENIEALEKGVIIMSLKNAFEKNRDLLLDYLLQEKNNKKDSFTLANDAFFSDGLFIYVPENVVLSAPIFSSFVLNDSLSHMTKVILVLEKGSEITYHETETSTGKKETQHIKEVLVFLEENSKIIFSGISKKNNNIFSLSNYKSYCKKNSKISWFFSEFGNKFSRKQIEVLLQGHGSENETNIIYFNNDNNHFDFTVDPHHLVENTTSNVLVKGVLKENSSSVFRGKIKIDKIAQKTNSYLSDHVMHLSGNSKSNSIPSLEIDANDVRASHGATIGKPDPEEIFYLMARGLKKEVAENLIIGGFFSPIVEKIRRDSLKETIEEEIKQNLVG